LGLSQKDALAISNFVRMRVGTQYSTKEALKTVAGGSKNWTRKQFCSRLVAQAYASVAHTLVPNANFCSPGDIKNVTCSLRFRAAPGPLPI